MLHARDMSPETAPERNRHGGTESSELISQRLLGWLCFVNNISTAMYKVFISRLIGGTC